MRPLYFFALALLALAACRSEDSAAIPTSPGSPGTPGLGVNASLQGQRPFPSDNAWNAPVDTARVDPNSDALIASIGMTKGLHPDFGASYGGGPFGIPYVVVSGDTPGVSVTFDYADESDPGAYPIPVGSPVEGGSSSTGDRHVLVIDRDRSSTSSLPPIPSSDRPTGPLAPGPSSISHRTHSVRPVGPRQMPLDFPSS